MDMTNTQTNKAPLIVAYGMGVDSTAVLVGLAQRGERPDLILFADTGDEKAATYAYLPIIQAWLAKVGFPQVTIVRNGSPRTGDRSLSARCLRNGTLPSPAYAGPGSHTCSIVWKIQPQQQFVSRWQPAKDAWARGQNVTQCIGYDAGSRDSCRAGKIHGKETKGYTHRYPLIEWGWDRQECERQIAAAGLPVPVKSACFHCPASKPSELAQLAITDPELLDIALRIEARGIEYGFLGKGMGYAGSFNWKDHLAAEAA